MKRVAVVCPPGLGDGLLSMILSHNLSLSRLEVTTFSTVLCELNDWFPNHEILPYPDQTTLHATLSAFDTAITTDHALVPQNFGNRLIVLDVDQFDKSISIADNMQKICETQLKLPYSETSNGMVIPTGLTWRSHSQRVVLHPISSSKKKDWPAEKFIELGRRLEKQGLSPYFCLNTEKRENWLKLVPEEQLPIFPSIHELACFIFESGSMIGNDSGVGHLASALNIPTLSLFARKSYSQLWRPGWNNDALVVTPPNFLPGARLRQKYWKQLLSVRKVLRTFTKGIPIHEPSTY